MDTSDDDSERYAELWRKSRQKLREYAIKHLGKVDTSIKTEVETDYDNCVEQFIRIVSSSDKAEQMKIRREQKEKETITIQNPINAILSKPKTE